MEFITTLVHITLLVTLGTAIVGLALGLLGAWASAAMRGGPLAFLLMGALYFGAYHLGAAALRALGWAL